MAYYGHDYYLMSHTKFTEWLKDELCITREKAEAGAHKMSGECSDWCKRYADSVTSKENALEYVRKQFPNETKTYMDAVRMAEVHMKWLESENGR